MNHATDTTDATKARDATGEERNVPGERATGPPVDAPNAPTPPHVDGWPFLGSTVAVVRESLDFGHRLVERGDVVTYDAFGERFVAVADPDAIEAILVSRSEEFRKGDWETDFGKMIAPDGLVFTEGEQWKRQRTALQESFTPAQVRSLADAIVDGATALVDDWANADTVTLRKDASEFTLSVLTRTLLDVDIDDDRGQVVADAVDAISDYTSPLTLAVPEWIPLPADRRYRTAMADLDALVADLVAERRRETGTEDYDDLLATMLTAVDADDGLRTDELRDQLVTFLGAGHETTATALTYVIWLLADDQGVRERLDDELDAVLDGGDPTFADVPQLQYTEAVIDEALRLYPPVYSLYREAHAPTTVGGYRIDPGETIQLSTYHVHRDDRWWDAPGEFRPERWMDGTEAGDDATVDDRPTYAYFPFGGGPRHCIGMRFARLELQLALATLAGELTFEQLGGFDPQPRLTLDPGDVRIRARRRR